MLLIGGEFLKLSSGLNIKCDKSKWNVGGSIAGIPQRIAAFPGADNEHDGCDALNGSCFLCVQKKRNDQTWNNHGEELFIRNLSNCTAIVFHLLQPRASLEEFELRKKQVIPILAAFWKWLQGVL